MNEYFIYIGNLHDFGPKDPPRVSLRDFNGNVTGTLDSHCCRGKPLTPP